MGEWYEQFTINRRVESAVNNSLNFVKLIWTSCIFGKHLLSSKMNGCRISGSHLRTISSIVFSCRVSVMVGFNSAIRTNDAFSKLYTQIAGRPLRKNVANFMYSISEMLRGMTKCGGNVPGGMLSSRSSDSTRQPVAPHRFNSHAQSIFLLNNEMLRNVL